ncbi:hypothetical protein J6590_012174 [Homalodisca vitripennis]|nr:hypothetical protein J6590_012174 [Homalodisca vitripennis]
MPGLYYLQNQKACEEFETNRGIVESNSRQNMIMRIRTHANRTRDPLVKVLQPYPSALK